MCSGIRSGYSSRCASASSGSTCSSTSVRDVCRGLGSMSTSAPTGSSLADGEHEVDESLRHRNLVGDVLPHQRTRPVQHVGGDLDPARGRKTGQEDGVAGGESHQLPVDTNAASAWVSTALSPSIEVHTSVYTTSAPETASRGSSRTLTEAPVALATTKDSLRPASPPKRSRRVKRLT